MEKLIEVRLRHLYLDVPAGAPYQPLDRWLEEQSAFDDDIDRKLYRLDAMPVPMTQEEVEWERMFARAKAHGDRRKGPSLAPASGLGRRIDLQRKLFAEEELDPYQERRLIELGLLRA